MENRYVVSPDDIIMVRKDRGPGEKIVKLYSNLALPSYVHGYSLAIQYMYNWFESKFEKGYFKGGIYVNGKHVLDDYKQFSKNVIKGQNPRARIEPTIEYDYDREGVDMYSAPPELYLKKSNFQTSFFKDYDKNLFLGLTMRSLRMNFNFKVRVNTRSQQLDIYNRMELYFRVGATQQDSISVDFHIPKSIILNIADKAGFETKNGEIVKVIDFVNYFNAHSDLPLLFKMRAINQKPEFFIRVHGLYTHIAVKDKLQLDDGERDGKLDYNFHIEMNATLTIPIPHFYTFYSAEELLMPIELKEMADDNIAIYSICLCDIPKEDEHHWMQAAISQYATDDGEKYVDLSSIFTGDNKLSQAINHKLSKGISPSSFINVKVYRTYDVPKEVNIEMDWKTFRANFVDGPEPEEVLDIAVYYDRLYLNSIETELNNYNSNRISSTNK